MIPDRRAEIGLPETVTKPQRNGHLPRWARVPASILVLVGTSALDQMTNRAEAVDLNCWVGLGLQVEPEFYAKGARISVIESGSVKRRELLDPTRERVIDLGVAPSNTTRGGKDARVVVYFAADQQGRQLTPSREAKVNCGQFEHVRYFLNREVTPVAPAATPIATSTPTLLATPTPDNRVATLKDEVQKLQKLVDQAKRAEEDKKLTETAEVRGETKGRAAAVAEEQEKTRIGTLIRQAEDRGRENYIAAVKAAAVVSSTAGAAGTRAGGGFEIPSIPSIPWEPLAGGLGILALVWAEFKSKKVQRTTKNIIRFPDRAFRRVILRQATVNVWP